jgi:hypothetical protein
LLLLASRLFLLNLPNYYYTLPPTTQITQSRTDHPRYT